MTYIPTFTLNNQSQRTIYEVEIFCTVDEGEFNNTFNPSIRPGRSITTEEMLPFATHSEFRPYVTTIGLYNEDGQLLVVGKLGQPVKIPTSGDITFVVKFDL